MELRDIKDYEGLYQVSDDGRVWSVKRKIFLRPTTWSIGYPRVILHKDGQQKGFDIHRLVAEAFIPNPDNLPIVNHKDESRDNNCVDNLEWCDAVYNNNYGTSRARCAEKQGYPIAQYDLEGNLIATYPSIREASRQLGFSYTCIGNVLKGRQKQTHNFFFKSLDKPSQKE